MPSLPTDYLSLIQIFARYFSNLVWQHAQILLVGAILVPGTRTVTAALRIMGLSRERTFETYHRVLNRAAWSSWALSHTLRILLVNTFVPTGPIVCGIDVPSNDVRVPRSRPKASIVIRCAPATLTLSKRVGCVG